MCIEEAYHLLSDPAARHQYDTLSKGFYEVVHLTIERLCGQDIISYCLILLDISRIVLKYTDFRVPKMYGNNDTFCGSTKI